MNFLKEIVNIKQNVYTFHENDDQFLCKDKLQDTMDYANFPSHSGNQNILCDSITLYCAGGCNEKKLKEKWSNFDSCDLGICTVTY